MYSSGLSQDSFSWRGAELEVTFASSSSALGGAFERSSSTVSADRASSFMVRTASTMSSMRGRRASMHQSCRRRGSSRKRRFSAFFLPSGEPSLDIPSAPLLAPSGFVGEAAFGALLKSSSRRSLSNSVSPMQWIFSHTFGSSVVCTWMGFQKSFFVGIRGTMSGFLGSLFPFAFALPLAFGGGGPAAFPAPAGDGGHEPFSVPFPFPFPLTLPFPFAGGLDGTSGPAGAAGGAAVVSLAAAAAGTGLSFGRDEAVATSACLDSAGLSVFASAVMAAVAAFAEAAALATAAAAAAAAAGRDGAAAFTVGAAVPSGEPGSPGLSKASSLTAGASLCDCGGGGGGGEGAETAGFPFPFFVFPLPFALPFAGLCEVSGVACSANFGLSGGTLEEVFCVSDEDCGSGSGSGGVGGGGESGG
mmetsp:Transcript_4287/g.10141  ORF Transcript_4287/g.10141 Transcript_4287/m.10141 type:complete len:417 (+) Transcript_4287:1529-2779(+)